MTTPNDSQPELKACPFCSKKAKVKKSSVDPCIYIGCTWCSAATATYFTESEAIAAWNRRAERDAVPKWLPIETAPTKGREMILLLTPSRFPQVAYSNTWWMSGFSVENKPTHWMPLPQLPDAMKEQQSMSQEQEQREALRPGDFDDAREFLESWGCTVFPVPQIIDLAEHAWRLAYRHQLAEHGRYDGQPRNLIDALDRIAAQAAAVPQFVEIVGNTIQVDFESTAAQYRIDITKALHEAGCPISHDDKRLMSNVDKIKWLADRQAAAVPAVPQWIPVSERLPEEGKRVLVLKDCGEGTASSRSVCYIMQELWMYSDGGIKSLDSYGYRATHWMPLPAAPIAGGV